MSRLKNTLVRFFFTVTVLLIFPFGGYVTAQNFADMDTLYVRIYKSIYGEGGSYNINNIAETGAFKNVSYPTVQPTPATGDPRGHLTEMMKIARAYQTNHDEFLYQAYIKAWNFWYKQNYKDTNWWWRQIGWPKTLYPSFVMMAKSMKTKNPVEYENLRSYLMHFWTPEFINSSLKNPSGANTTDVANYVMATAIVTDDTLVIRQASEIFKNVIAIVRGPKDEGIQSDYSFSQHIAHGRQLYMGSYGREYVNGLISFITLTANTCFQIPTDKMNIFETLMLEGVSWISYRNMQDQHQYGRGPSGNNYASYLSFLSSLCAANTPQNARLKDLYNWMKRTTPGDSVNIQRGNKMFWRHDYMVHKGRNYFTTSRMTSTRTTSSESCCDWGQGINNYYTGAGVNYIYVQGTEYSEIRNGMNWRRLPGITSPQWPTSVALPDVDWGANGSNLDPFAGGTSDGKTGSCGFIYSKKNPEVDVIAHKSWFYLENFIVALGSGISAGVDLGVPYATTVNQVKYKNGFIADIDGVPASILSGQVFTPEKSRWAYINNIGYQFITNNQLNYEVTTNGTTTLAWMGFNHGNKPKDAQYAYAIYPCISQDQLKIYVNHPPFSILSNSTSVQAIAENQKRVVQAIFYKSGKLTLPPSLGSVEVDKPAVVQLRWIKDSLYISVANPYCETKPVESVTLKISGLYSNDLSKEDVQKRITTLSVAMPANDLQGSTVTVGLKTIIKVSSEGAKN